MEIQAAVERLNLQLPLKARQEQLPIELKVAHEMILTVLVTEGRTPDEIELRDILGDIDIHEALQRLGADDLIVLDSAGQKILGAYPVTLEKTVHRITVNDHHIHAMCALDAVSVAPMFDAEVLIESKCHASNADIRIKMRAGKILSVSPGTNVTVGIRWQMPKEVAAHSMCLEMVFFKDRTTAEAWQQDDVEHISLFSLPVAVEFGKAFFRPLLE
jgi:mercuric reductase